MHNQDQQVAGEAPWPSATELNLPADYPAICSYPADKIDQAYALLETTCGSKLTAYYNRFGTIQAGTLQSKLYFAASVLLEQTGQAGHKRQMVAKLRQLHLENPDYPSIATVYRTIGPLKVWLGKQCNLDHAPSATELRTDKRPLLLLTHENLRGLVETCKTFRKFLDTYRPNPRKKTAATPGATTATTTGNDADSDSGPAHERAMEPIILICGRLSKEEQHRIASNLGAGGQVIELAGEAAAMARQWLSHQTPGDE